jgi:hypothetical protein
MGIRPFEGVRRRARIGAVAVGIAASGLVAGIAAPVLADASVTAAGGGVSARGAGGSNPAPQGTAARTLTADTTNGVQATLHSSVVGVAAETEGSGYWEVASDGGLFAAGSAAYLGSMGGHSLAARVVGVAADPATGGYWEVAADGGIFAFGAPYFGSMGGHSLHAPIVGVAAAPDGQGYWEVAADGGIFTFGDAKYFGSMGARSLHAPIVGVAAAPDGRGYWEVGADGGIFSFGDAKYFGSMGGHALHAPIVGVATDPKGGYWEVARDGGVFSFGGAAYSGSLGGKHLTSPIVGLATTSDAKGYWEVAANGAVYAFGGAQYAGAAKVSLTAKPSGTGTGSVAPAPNVAGGSSSTGTESGSVTTPTSNGHPYLPPANPPSNISPDPAYTYQEGASVSSSTSFACWQLGSTAWAPQPGSAQCVAAEVAATDHARAEEGLPGIRLPSDYGSLTPEEQLFVLTDIERVSRGEQPVAGLSSLLNGYAQSGAASGTDPRFDFSALASSDWWGSNVVSGAVNALDANYTWMYDDGYGGYNVDCTSPSAKGCWGHRDNELTSNYGGTLVMGAGEVAQSTGLESLSELLVVVTNHSDVPPLYYTWAEAVAAGAGG